MTPLMFDEDQAKESVHAQENVQMAVKMNFGDGLILTFNLFNV